jgi:putative ABC transport system permease protein
MIYNYLKIAIRNLLKYRFISFINLFGLTVGLTCCLLITTYILHEISYDKFNDQHDRIWRITRSFNNPETGAQSLHLGTIAPPFAPLLKNQFSEIENITRLLSGGSATFRYGDKMFNEEDIYFADEQFFDFFKVNVVKGDPKTALNDPMSVMLTEEVARKYFGDAEPMDKMIRMDNQLTLKVTGVFKPLPSNSHFHPNIMVSFNTLKDSTVYGESNLRTNWSNNSFFTYIKVPHGFSPERLEAKFPAFLDEHMADVGSRFKPSQWTKLHLQKLTDIHLHSHLDYEAEENGDIKRVYIFSAIALFVLLIACINYMNLSTARSALRAREIGVRKVVGARRKEIIAQFLTESVIVCWLAIILAFALTWLLIPYLNQVSGQDLSINILLRWQVMVPLVLVPFVVGIMSGLYPALFMSSFQPVKVLKGMFKVGGGNVSFRKVLVTAQFAISIALIICTTVVYRQMNYMQQKALGFDREHVLSLPYINTLSNSYESFRNELLSNASVLNAGRSSRIPTSRLLDASGTRIMRGDSLAPVSADIKYVVADKDFINTYGVKIVAGRNFSRDFSTDSASFLINEAAARVLGFASAQDAIGKRMGYGGRDGQLVGVFNDFHFESLHQQIVPLVLFIPRNENTYNRISIKISGNNIPAALAHIEKTWKRFLPDVPWQYNFLDESYDRLYQSEQRQGTIFTIFAGIAIFIACLGLFGLSAFTITQRIKEIGIRKVLGASTTRIVTLLSRDFMILVAIAALIAFPIAGTAMYAWLQDFAYRTTMSWWIFPLAGIIALMVALATICFQAVKAALANPVKSLRTE